jgi:hypothetical protein
VTVPVGRLDMRAASALCQFGPLTQRRFGGTGPGSSGRGSYGGEGPWW